MKRTLMVMTALAAVAWSAARAGEHSVLSLKDLSDVELKSAGIHFSQQTQVHIRALGGGGDYGWTYKSDQMFAYGWIINADTRKLVWEMTVDNSSRSKDDRSFDGSVTLDPGDYEVYFTAYAFVYHTTFTHINVNVDHREKPLFGWRQDKGKNFFSWFTDWFTDDIGKDWAKRSRNWGIEMLVDDGVTGVSTFTPPKERPNVVFKAVGLGEHELVRRGFSLSGPTTLSVYAIGEGIRGGDPADYGWIVSTSDRKRVWDMGWGNTSQAGGAQKNLMYSGDLQLEEGEYVLYYITDGTHSAADWNAAPPSDPLNYGVTISVRTEKEKHNFTPVEYNEDENVIVSLTKMRNSQYRSEGFTLKQPAKLRIYAFGERNNNRMSMADYGVIMDASTRQKVWMMDAERSYHGGGASKNRFFDEILSLPKGSYIVSYTTDDSHAYDEWNVEQPFDPEHYGITVMGAGEHFSNAIVAKFVEQRAKNIIAQIVRVGNNADKSERFTLDKPTRVRIYAIGEGQNREMYDYGWIENAKTGTEVWEMTYAMTFHAGGGRKNRMVNMTILLERGEYKLHWRSDDSHSYGDWNVDPPDDPEYWGITLYKAEGTEVPPIPPVPPGPKEEEEN